MKLSDGTFECASQRMVNAVAPGINGNFGPAAIPIFDVCRARYTQAASDLLVERARVEEQRRIGVARAAEEVRLAAVQAAMPGYLQEVQAWEQQRDTVVARLEAVEDPIERALRCVRSFSQPDRHGNCRISQPEVFKAVLGDWIPRGWKEGEWVPTAPDGQAIFQWFVARDVPSSAHATGHPYWASARGLIRNCQPMWRLAGSAPELSRYTRHGDQITERRALFIDRHGFAWIDDYGEQRSVSDLHASGMHAMANLLGLGRFALADRPLVPHGI